MTERRQPWAPASSLGPLSEDVPRSGEKRTETWREGCPCCFRILCMAAMGPPTWGPAQDTAPLKVGLGLLPIPSTGQTVSSQTPGPQGGGWYMEQRELFAWTEGPRGRLTHSCSCSWLSVFECPCPLSTGGCESEADAEASFRG